MKGGTELSRKHASFCSLFALDSGCDKLPDYLPTIKDCDLDI